MTQHFAMLQRNLLYTGVTRGKKLVVLIEQKKAVAIAVRNLSGRRPVVEAAGMAPPQSIFITADRRGELSLGALNISLPHRFGIS
jgi:hypothetical protein